MDLLQDSPCFPPQAVLFRFRQRGQNLLQVPAIHPGEQHIHLRAVIGDAEIHRLRHGKPDGGVLLNDLIFLFLGFIQGNIGQPEEERLSGFADHAVFPIV